MIQFFAEYCRVNPAKNLPPRFRHHPLLHLIFGLFAFSALGLPTASAVIKVDATTLIEEYNNNEVAADAKYKGKEVEVTGEVDRISSTFGKSSVTLGGLMGVSCYFSKAHEADIGALSKGQTVAIRGRVDGMMMGVNLKDCQLVGASGGAAAAGGSGVAPRATGGTLEVTSEELDNAYEANEVKADSTYKGKTVVIRGPVEKIAKDLFDKPYIELRGNSDFLGVQCYVTPAAQARTAELSAGTEVKLRGKVKGKTMVVVLESCEFVD